MSFDDLHGSDVDCGDMVRAANEAHGRSGLARLSGGSDAESRDHGACYGDRERAADTPTERRNGVCVRRQARPGRDRAGVSARRIANVAVGPIQDASMNVVRGSEGDCVIVTASAPPPFTHSATSFARIQGDALASVKVDECHATLATATPRGIWLYDDDKRAIYRAELAANVAMTVVAFPAGLGECTKIVEVTSLVALDDNDVWATARCDGDGLGERLLHTEPVGTVDSWPAPP
jgi:hypothetical protein